MALDAAYLRALMAVTIKETHNRANRSEKSRTKNRENRNFCFFMFGWESEIGFIDVGLCFRS